MLNIAHTIKGNKLTLVVDLSKPQGDSGSGKSTIIASTQGTQSIGDNFKFGLNVYQPKK